MSLSLTIADQTQVGEARRTAQQLATAELGFGETEAGKVSIVVTELASNLVKHGGGGELILRAISRAGTRGLEILALDKGAGMAEVGACLRDGYSTAGSPGTGLGAISRLSDDFEISSVVGLGTAILTRHWARPVARSTDAFETGAVSVPVHGERVCGDAWATGVQGNHSLFLVVDGLGHGPIAAEAAEEAVRVFEQSRHPEVTGILRDAHDALRKTRGAAAAIADVRVDEGRVHYAGVGNISAATLSPTLKSQSLVSSNGTLGGDTVRVKQFDYAWDKDSVLVMHSDGLTARWQLDRYPGLMRKHPSLIAGVLYRDYKRGTDDATVLVLREAR
jgi:anti-sigma regulatory factor (Ser/Thr protein kinase)/serine/threonine protein phosphatase PrpC